MPPFGINGQRPDPSQMKAMFLKRFDTNGNGQIDDTERANARATIQARREQGGGFPGFGGQRPDPQQFFSKIDTNADGRVSIDEFQAFTPQRPSWNGEQPPAPTAEMKQTLFSKLDANADGSVTQEEFAAGRPPMPPGGGFGGPGGPGGHRPDLTVLLNGADTDANGNISQAEFLAFTPQLPAFNGQQPPAPTDEMKQKMFARLDADGDGIITQEELANARPPRPPFPPFGANQGNSSGISSLLSQVLNANGQSGGTNILSLLSSLLQQGSVAS